MWRPQYSIVNIYAGVPYEDPKGLLQLSLRQGKHFSKWVRPHEIIDPSQYVNNRIDIATQITGYEVM